MGNYTKFMNLHNGVLQVTVGEISRKKYATWMIKLITFYIQFSYSSTVGLITVKTVKWKVWIHKYELLSQKVCLSKDLCHSEAYDAIQTKTITYLYGTLHSNLKVTLNRLMAKDSLSVWQWMVHYAGMLDIVHFLRCSW